MNNKLSLYVHVPFCKSKCSYCDFVSYAGADDLMADYFDAVDFELSLKPVDDRIASIYIGGGTPGYVPGKYIEALMNSIRYRCRLALDCEISIEVNPGSLSEEKLKIYKDAGINRISMGMQATQNDILKRIGRIHDLSKTRKAVEMIKKAGFDNFNLDMMFSLPGQTLKNVEETALFAAQSGAAHISAYSLILEENTPINQLYKDNVYTQDDELDRQMYRRVNEILGSYGFERYEISNFALPGYECKHNLYCWDFCDYLGVGAAAHSFVANTRYVNTPDLKEYINGVYQLTNNVLEQKESKEELIEDYIMLAFRKTSGLKVKDFEDRFGVDFEKTYEKELSRLFDEGLLQRTQKGFALTEKGFDFESAVVREFFF